MKKFVSLILALMLSLTMFAIPAMAEEAVPAKVGMLTILNMNEEEAANLAQAYAISISRLIANDQIQGVLDAPEEPLAKEFDVVFYDTLDAMLMGLNAGDINVMYIYHDVAEYLCAKTDQLAMMVALDHAADTDVGAVKVYRGRLRSDFSFMLTEDREALRDEIDEAIDALTADGTLDRLVAEQIDAVIAGDDIAPVEMPEIDGAETIKVAVTGSLPPMDYITADGTPAGFNTALLAEISNRIGKNIELVQVDSAGRAAALSSGVVDVVFWTRANTRDFDVANRTEEERTAGSKRREENCSEEELEALNLVRSLTPAGTVSNMDIPEGTIITKPYYSDRLLPVITKAFLETLKAR